MSIAHTNVVAKIAAVAAGLALVLSSVAVAVPARAATTAELEAQVAALLAQLQAMQGGTTTGAAFTMDMTIGASGAEVTRLQNWLISKGYSIPAGATGYFGAQTAAAVAAYQSASGITPAVGYFGPMTRAKVNASLTTGGGTTTPDDDDNDNGDLEGGAGSIDSTDLISGISNEDVGEDEEDVEVAGLEIEVDDGSDIELTAVRLTFAQTDGTSDEFEDYVSEVSVWLDGEEVARLDADEFNDDNDFEKTVSLDSGAIIRAGETGDLVVAVTAVSSLSSDEINGTWTVDFEQVRFQDADGATISETVTEDTRSFNFVSFASAADTDITLSLTSGDEADEINDAHIIDVDATSDTDNVEILAFTIEVEGDSEITLDDLPVTFVTVGADLDGIASEVRLMMDGEEVGSESVPTAATTTTQIIFDDLDVTLDADAETEFTIEVDLLSIADDMDAGDTIKATIAEVQLEAADTEDESGEEVGTSLIGGSANGEASEVRDSGIEVEFVSADADVTSPETGADRGIFTITFDVTAFDDDAYVDATAPDTDGGATESEIGVTGSGTVVADITTSTGATESATAFLVEEGQTERFSIVTNITATADGFFEVDLEELLYTMGTDADGDTVYTFNLDDFKTNSVYLDTNA